MMLKRYSLLVEWGELVGVASLNGFHLLSVGISLLICLAYLHMLLLLGRVLINNTLRGRAWHGPDRKQECTQCTHCSLLLVNELPMCNLTASRPPTVARWNINRRGRALPKGGELEACWDLLGGSAGNKDREERLCEVRLDAACNEYVM